MFSWKRSDQPAKPGFVTAARSAFQFLELEYGFRCARVREPIAVRYESPHVYLTVYHDVDRYVDVEIGTLGAGHEVENCATLFMLVGAVAPERADEIGCRAETPQQIDRCVSAAAELVKSYGVGAASRRAFGVRGSGRRIGAQREEEGRRIWNHRRAAQVAWDARDYAAVVAHFQQIEDKLHPDEIRRLETARRNSG